MPLTTLLVIHRGALWTDTHATCNVVGYTPWCSMDWHTCHLQRCWLYIVVLCGRTHATHNVVSYTLWCSVDWHTSHLQRCSLYIVVLCGLTHMPLTTLLAIHRVALWTDTHATYNVVSYTGWCSVDWHTSTYNVVSYTGWCSVDWHTCHLQRCMLYIVVLWGLIVRWMPVVAVSSSSCVNWWCDCPGSWIVWTFLL